MARAGEREREQAPPEVAESGANHAAPTSADGAAPAGETPSAPEGGASPPDEAAAQSNGGPPSFQAKRIAQTALVVALVVAAIYVLLPKLVGLEDAIAGLGEADPIWVVIALAFAILSFVAYVALFRGVVGQQVVQLDWAESYQITMAGLAATRLFAAGGAGGVVLTYWALRKAGMSRRQSAIRMIAFLFLLYFVYALALFLFGILLRTGVLPGDAPVGLTIVPAVFAAVAMLLGLLVALIPIDLQGRLARFRKGGFFGRLAHRIATVPETASRGARTGIDFMRDPGQGATAVLGAIGFWAANIGILWASFAAFGLFVPFAVLVQGFFLGMLANLFPFAPGGVGAVDAGMIGTFVLFGLPGSTVLVAVLLYRLMAFWLPILPGVIAFLQLRRTVARWEERRVQAPVGSESAEALPGPIVTS